MKVDLTVAAIPIYAGTMAAEIAWYRRRRRHGERIGPGDYETDDTIASLAMGAGSLLAPLVMPTVLEPITPGVGRYGKALVGAALGAISVTTVADRLARLDAGDDEDHERPTRRRRRIARAARAVAKAGGVAAVVTGGVAVTTAVASKLDAERMWERRVLPDLGTGPLAWAAAIAGWDFIYYWNHRFSHEVRALWAIHVVHHSSERYNLSTALRQPVADAFGVFVPYSLLAALGIRPSVILQARAVNLLYQYWIHTEVIDRIGPAEQVLNTPSHHRVHHGSQRQYLDRNHGSILITWDRLFGTFEPEEERVVYGLTKNLDSFNPATVAVNEHSEMLKDVAAARTWRDRASHVVRHPGWRPAPTEARAVDWRAWRI
jgi:sterol desaturase/sphingolipid hydroxylase (fatty acid hydroxylase superfamily)